MKKYLFLLWPVLWSVVVIPVSGQSVSPSSSGTRSQTIPEKLDTLMAALVNEKLFNGSVLVATKGEIILQKGYSYKNLEKKVPDDAHTIFQIGSITKQFTSAIILQLQEQKKLSVRDKLSKYIPDYPHGDSITIENLLTHTSGIFNYTNDGAFMKTRMTVPIPRDSLIALFKYKPLDFRPGEKFSYSNSGYILLGYIIEKVTGRSYFRVVRENIFQPLHMDHSGFDFKGLTSPDKAIGYNPPAPGQPAPIVDSSVSFAAGAIYSTTGDLYKWDRALYTEKIISAASREKAFTPHLEKYGYGWSIDTLYGKRIVQHGGGIPGFLSYILRVPEDGTCIIVLNNLPSTAPPGKVAGDINALLNGREYEIPRPRVAIGVDTAILRQYTGDYELQPGFVLTMSLVGGALMSQATGQGVVPLFAEKENFFFAKMVDAQIEFVKGTDGKIEKLVLHQNGRLMPAKKIR